VLDATDSAYLVGYASAGIDGSPSAGGLDAVIAKITPGGVLAWSKLVGGYGSDKFNSIALGPDGYIYASGSADNDVDGQRKIGDKDGLVVKFDVNGNKVWTKIIGGSTADDISASVVDSKGNLYVAGTTSSSFAGQRNNGNTDGFLAKLNSDGTYAWVRLVGSLAVDSINDLELDPSGFLYAAGSTMGSMDGEIGRGSTDAFVIKYSTSGDRDWTRILGSAAGDYGDDLELSAGGDVYLAGRSNGNFGGKTGTDNDVFISRLNGSGVLQGTDLIGFVASEGMIDDSVTAFRLDGVKGFYLGGTTNGGTDPSLKAKKFPYSPDGYVAHYSFGGTLKTSVDVSSIPLLPPFNTVAFGLLTIDGKLERGSTITANTSSINDADGLGSFSYKWSVKDSKGAWSDVGTNKTLAITTDMVGKSLKASVSFKDGKGNAESISSDEVKVDSIDRSIIAAMTPADWEMYVDRYPLTLGVIYNNLIKPSGQSKAAFGESHFINNGQYEGRVIKVTTGKEDLNDYGAYVENYGTTLLDVFRTGVGPTDRGDRKLSLFEWGKWHFETFGKAEGRDVSGGVDWGAIVRNDSRLLSQFTDAQRADSKLTAFKWGMLNQSVISTTLGKELAVGSALDDTLQGNRVFGQGGADVVIGSAAADILHGGFGNDIIIGIEQAAAVKDIPVIIPTATPLSPDRYVITTVGGAFYIDGKLRPTLDLLEGSTYIFDQSHRSNLDHPLRLSLIPNGPTEYTTGVTSKGTPGSAGAQTLIEVPIGAPTLYYFCTNHSGMGGEINTKTSSHGLVRPAKDYVYGGPGDDQFVLAKGAWMQIQDFRKGSDLIRLGNFTKAQITLEENLSLGSPSTDFVDTTTGQTLATVYGQRAGDFTYAIASRGLANVFV